MCARMRSSWNPCRSNNCCSQLHWQYWTTWRINPCMHLQVESIQRLATSRKASYRFTTTSNDWPPLTFDHICRISKILIDTETKLDEGEYDASEKFHWRDERGGTPLLCNDYARRSE